MSKGRIKAVLFIIVFLLVIAVAFLTPFRLKKPATFGKIVMLLVGIAGMGLVLTGGLNL